MEFLPVVDYPIYKFMPVTAGMTAVTAPPPAARDVEAIENIREFYAFVLNSIDLRYQSIVSTAIAIQVVFAGIFIADTPGVSTWTENIKVSAKPRDQVNCDDALTGFKQWLALQTFLPSYDHAMAFTGYDLVRNGSNSVAGIAWMNGACDHATPYANSISEDHFEATIAAIAAHELGHNLGSNHDGNGNACSADDNYLMSSSIGYVTDARATNHFKFSTCSVTQMEDYIATLDRKNNNCLLTSTFNTSALDPYNGLEAGLLYNADVQCEANVGPGSYLCRSLYTAISEVYPYDVFFTGKQYMLHKDCLGRHRVREPEDNCPQGDQPGIYVNNMTCKAAAAAYPMYCYQTVFPKRCCESCRQLYTGIKGCEYGDHNTGCKLSSCPNYDVATLASGCCGTCGNISPTSGSVVPHSTCPQTSTTSPITTSSSTTTLASTSTTKPPSATTWTSTSATTSTTTTPSITTITTTSKTTPPSTTTTTTTSTAPPTAKQTSTTSSTTTAEQSTASRILFPVLIPVVCILMTFFLF